VLTASIIALIMESVSSSETSVNFNETLVLMMEAISVSETSVSFHQTTRLNIPENGNLHTRFCNNLKYHFKRSEASVMPLETFPASLLLSSFPAIGNTVPRNERAYF
jgi:hypothetical protein